MSEHPRIAFYIPSFERGGVERLIINISDKLIERGASVDVLVYRYGSFIEQLPEGVDVRDISTRESIDRIGKALFPIQIASGIMSIPGYVSYLRAYNPDLLISLQVSPFALVGVALSRTDPMIVIRESNTPSVATATSDILLGKLSPYAKRFTYARADRVVTVSEGAKEDVIDWLGLDPDQVITVYNPTNNDRIKSLAEEPIDHPWYGGNDPVVTSVGRFYNQKDFETLLKAFAIVREHVSARLVIVGDGANRSRLENLTREINLDDVVDFVGYQDNPYKYMAGADLFVLSSNYEGLPNALIEALCVGTPAVATDCPSGPAEILLDGTGGWLVPVGAQQEMADAIVEALKKPDLSESKLETAREGLDRFTPERAARCYLNLLPDC